MDLSKVITPNLLKLQDVLYRANYRMWLVGGVVRDLLLGIDPKDIDLCTDATPDVMIKLFRAAGFRVAETGLKHGTVSVVFDHGAEVYEITTLRVDSDQDGRHATVEYVTDINLDLGRRDLTINAIAMTLEGEIIDPFGGVSDLHNRFVRFVGEASVRMQEDYLRILRWLRFADRIAPGVELHGFALGAARANAEGLRKVSRERVWSEMAKIVSGNNGPLMIHHIYAMQLAGPIDLPALYRRTGDQYPDCPKGGIDRMTYVSTRTKNPITRLVALLGEEATHLPTAWKWSAEERDLCMFLIDNNVPTRMDYKRMLAVNGVDREWVLELSKLRGDSPARVRAIQNWVIPVFPLKGGDLIAEKGYKPGPDVGLTVKTLKNIWAQLDYQPTREDLLRTVVARS